MRQLATDLKPYRKQLIIGPLFKLAEALLELTLPVLMAKLIDVGVKENDPDTILRMSGLMLLTAGIGYLCALICQHAASIASQGYGTLLRNRLFAKIASFSHAELDRFPASSLANRVTNDVNQLQLAVAMFIRLALRGPFLCIGGIIAAMLIDVKLALIVVASIPVFAVALFLIITQAVRLYQLVQKKLDALSVVISENLSGVRIIRAFARRQGERNRFDAVNTEHADASYIVSRLASLSNPLTTLIMNAAVLLILRIGGDQIQIGELEQGEVIAFVSYMSQILLALIVITNLVVLFTRALASAKRVSEVLAVTPSLSDSATVRPFPHGKASVEFDHVTFSYGGGDPALENVSFRLEPGQTAGVLGLTGSGKSTLVSLLSRFYDTSGGAVRIGGTDVRSFAQTELRKSIAVVPQKTTLFSGTVAENLRLGGQNATDEELWTAARAAQAAEFLERLDDGLAHRVERGGANLSGGQRQRLSIARALAAKPSLLILDDAASALDYATEARLRQALRDWQQKENLTVFIISQRASSVRHADKILVLDDGRLLAQGTHEELLSSCPLYAEICRSQEEGGKSE